MSSTLLIVGLLLEGDIDMKDEQTLRGARTEHGTQIPTYDDGSGPVWLYREAGGLVGVVRARTWEDAYEICQDEIMTRVDEGEVIEAFGFYVMHHNDRFWACPDVEVGDARWQTFDQIPSREVLGSWRARGNAVQACFNVIREEELDLVGGYEWQPNATGTGIVSIDLNGQDLQLLTDELREQLGITLED